MSREQEIGAATFFNETYLLLRTLYQQSCHKKADYNSSRDDPGNVRREPLSQPCDLLRDYLGKKVEQCIHRALVNSNLGSELPLSLAKRFELSYTAKILGEVRD